MCVLYLHQKMVKLRKLFVFWRVKIVVQIIFEIHSCCSSVFSTAVFSFLFFFNFFYSSIFLFFNYFNFFNFINFFNFSNFFNFINFLSYFSSTMVCLGLPWSAITKEWSWTISGRDWNGLPMLMKVFATRWSRRSTKMEHQCGSENQKLQKHL